MMAFVFLLIFVVFGPALSGLLLWIDHRVSEQMQRDEYPRSRVWRIPVSLGLLLCCAVMFVIVVNSNPANDESLIAGLAAISFAMLFVRTIQGFLPLPWVESEGADGQRILLSPSLWRSWIGWAIVLFPVAFPLLPILFVAVPVLSILFPILRRSTAYHLLVNMAASIEHGLPMWEAAEGVDSRFSPSRRRKLQLLTMKLKAGDSLSDALEEARHLVPASTVLAIRAAEGTVALPMVLRREANRARDNLERSSSRVNLVMYTQGLLLTGVVLWVIFAFLMYWIVPKYKEIMNDFGLPLPKLTVWIINRADQFGGWPWLGIPILIVMACWFEKEPGLISGRWRQKFWTRFFPRKQAPEALRMMSAVAESGRPLHEGLNMLANDYPYEGLRTRLAHVASDLEAGEPNWSSLARERLLTPSETQALDSAGHAGKLGWAMSSFAVSLEQQLWSRYCLRYNLLNVLLLLVVAFLVGTFVVSMFVPLVDLIHVLSVETSA